MQTVLITGGAGFIGSNFIPFILKKHKNLSVVNLDLLTYAGDLENLKEVEGNTNYTFIKGDICDRKLVESLFKQYNFTSVIHFAAESHVDNSIHKPDAFVRTNVFGTFNVLDVAKKHWMDDSNNYKKEFKNSRFHHISTDEVYGSLGETGFFTEKTPYAPNSPYSASKASSDFLVRSYYHTYGLNVVTTNCSNNYGPKQHDEKLIPTIIRKALSGENIPIYGDGKNIRDWLYVLDHCKGIELVYHNGKAGETYNVGGKNEYNNLYIANKICSVLDNVIPKKNSYKNQITFVKDRLGHDFRYAIDATKIENELGWKADENFDEGIKKTIHSYLKKYN
ncbi:dTDP-glucose 4,6-dehydratase [Polaribacter reichenbachii]|uniref:dTDP-glucose 4,6-dehydratase n=1 Tax=Polaribacter reichenbachii TaxID=996801 RepID=A0A1B8TWZ8_9FLAO|nr:dTDP-glucose 4,6-dehydratase [Polaribacter reichenbachii]APZ45337.1 dTDP-glucose 4,6-dehydratase [Polaribacter reichenbachii]AUC20506.1 dTDP-glucose 4,6-dehydratase [Polaribacter reichenbachii]OBY64019.1 dTDP-glucose 4,6-dehydratase [Polaribacter reichenbachii]